MISHSARAAFSLLAAALLLASPALPYDTDLTSEALRDAYFLGQRADEKTSKFFDAYTRHLPIAKSGPYISQITLLTPYALVVDSSRQKTQGYSAQQASEEYHQRGDTLRVYVRIEFTATYTYLQATQSAQRVASEQNLAFQLEEFWRDFGYVLSQQESPRGDSASGTNSDQRDARDDSNNLDSGTPRHTIVARYADASAIYGNGENGGGLSGAVVSLDYDAADVSSAPATFEVITPADDHISVSFDLSKLR